MSGGKDVGLELKPEGSTFKELLGFRLEGFVLSLFVWDTCNDMSPICVNCFSAVQNELLVLLLNWQNEAQIKLFPERTCARLLRVVDDV